MEIKAAKRLAVIGLTALGVYMFSALGVYERVETAIYERIEAGRMLNVTYTDSAGAAPAAAVKPEEREDAPLPRETPKPRTTPSPKPSPELLSAVLDSGAEDALETTIRGGLSIKNETDYSPDINLILAQGPGLSLPAEGPQILIIHTHGSEAYTQAGLDRYDAEDNNRTSDTRYNIIRVGDELAERLEAEGLSVIHDREIYDYPSYTGSYTRSGAAVQEYLRQYPDIAMVIDLHRDALGSEGVVYKTVAEEQGVCASQVMLLVGTDASGLEHPNWQSNLSLALYLQQAVSEKHPTLMRPVSLVQQRYNQHLTPGSMIIEVGSSGNTLQEALSAIRLFADAAAPALSRLVESAEEAAE